ncbi:Rep_fac-A_C domain-containing protein [Raphanus sativus]|nr:Rep_fac-A_C domain-containing protein [Raphanus sativus]
MFISYEQQRCIQPCRLVEQDTGVRPAAPLLRSYTKVESLSIAELNNFVITAPSQDIDFICNWRVTGIKMDKGWCYVSCSNCAKKLQRTASSFTCVPCNNSNAVGILRVVCLLRWGYMTKLHNMRAYEAGHLLGGDDDNVGGSSKNVKVKAGGSSNVDGAAGKVKKARKA